MTYEGFAYNQFHSAGAKILFIIEAYENGEHLLRLMKDKTGSS